MVATIKTVTPLGYDSVIVDVETDIKKGLPSMQIVGLGNKAVDESRERVRSAITNSMLDFPNQKIIVNLAPAEIPKDGAHFDLPIAISILVASGQIKKETLHNVIIAGELALDGTIRPIKGAINIAEAASLSNNKTVILPLENAEQALLVSGIDVIGTSSLKELFLHFRQEKPLTPLKKVVRNTSNNILYSPVLDDIKGQLQAKRALTIAVAGRHNILLSGPPGSGKTMLAKTLVGLLPELTDEEIIATTKIHSLAGELQSGIMQRRPLRSPHHTASIVSITGGGNKPKPGEISLAHLGVLFLDELPEYPRSVLESLRQPLEDRKISISRASGYSTYPADFMLLATMNPCPCGYFGDTKKECSCGSNQILAYQKKLSGPLLDRIDMIITVARVNNKDLIRLNSHDNSQQNNALQLIETASTQQRQRFKGRSTYNGSAHSKDLAAVMQLSKNAEDLLISAADKMSLSARSYFKVIKVARTIADMEESDEIKTKHLAEALQYRESISM